MNIQEFAKMLDGNEMGREISKADAIRAKELGFVVVFGYSDDGAELRGAIDDEISCPDGRTVYLDNDGIFHECESGCRHACKAREKCKTIVAIWDKDGYSWVYETDIPHATFDIMEDGQKYCRGTVFDVKSLYGNAESKESANQKLLRLLELIKIYNEADALHAEFEAFAGYDEPIETIEELIEAMEVEMSYWEPESEEEIR